MRNPVPSPIGDRGGQVRYLERGDTDFSLTDGDGDDGGEFPAVLAVALVVHLRRRQGASKFSREVASQLVAEAEALDIFIPLVERFSDVAVLLVLENIAEGITEVGIAGHHDGLFEGER